MMVKKSYYGIMTYLKKNVARKATLSPIGNFSVYICYLPEMDSYIRFIGSSIVYELVKIELMSKYLDNKIKYPWDIDELSELDQKAIQAYIKNNGFQTQFFVKELK